MTEPFVLDSVAKRYRKVTAVDGVSLAGRAGECLALLGHNGAGKTTLMKLMLGLTRPTGGSIRVLGATPEGRAGRTARQRVGFLPENVAFYDQMTGREVIRFFGRLRRLHGRDGDDLLDRVGLAHAADRRVKTYSKGMRQRLGLAQALLGDPQLLLLDEPTTGLDPLLRQEVFRIIAELTAAGCTVILSSHVLTELESRTDRLAIMSGGKLTALGTLDELRAAAGLPTRIRLAAVERADGLAERLGGLASLERVNGQCVELNCFGDEPRQVFRAIGEASLPIDGIDVIRPSLDDIYRHYSGGAAP